MDDLKDIRATAQKEIEQEWFRAAVDQEKKRLLTHRSFAQRIFDAFPFTIVIKGKTK